MRKLRQNLIERFTEEECYAVALQIRRLGLHTLLSSILFLVISFTMGYKPILLVYLIAVFTFNFAITLLRVMTKDADFYTGLLIIPIILYLLIQTTMPWASLERFGLSNSLSLLLLQLSTIVLYLEPFLEVGVSKAILNDKLYYKYSAQGLLRSMNYVKIIELGDEFSKNYSTIERMINRGCDYTYPLYGSGFREFLKEIKGRFMLCTSETKTENSVNIDQAREKLRLLNDTLECLISAPSSEVEEFVQFFIKQRKDLALFFNYDEVNESESDEARIERVRKASSLL